MSIALLLIWRITGASCRYDTIIPSKTIRLPWNPSPYFTRQKARPANTNSPLMSLILSCTVWDLYQCKTIVTYRRKIEIEAVAQDTFIIRSIVIGFNSTLCCISLTIPVNISQVIILMRKTTTLNHALFEHNFYSLF